jgi:hypothetical protein
MRTIRLMIVCDPGLDMALCVEASSGEGGANVDCERVLITLLLVHGAMVSMGFIRL